MTTHPQPLPAEKNRSRSRCLELGATAPGPEVQVTGSCPLWWHPVKELEASL